MGYKTSARGWKGRDDLIPLVCTNCGKPFNCPPEYLDFLIDPARPFHPICFFNGNWRNEITQEMKERIEHNRAVLDDNGYKRLSEEEIMEKVIG